jgi:HPt (histidine-containing phosphotransfer) domain-containing protein
MKEVSLLSSNGVNVDEGIELLGDIETYDEILEDFLTEFDEKMTKIINYKESSDMENYAIMVHALKSDSKYLGFTNLAELAYQHEMESKVNNTQFINNNFEQLINEANRIIDIVKQYLGK